MVINGEVGSDVIWASAWDDTLNGRECNDVLFGEVGVDSLTAGFGADFFNLKRHQVMMGLKTIIYLKGISSNFIFKHMIPI